MKSLQRVINAFRKLPGVGPRQAERFALYLLRTSEAQAAEFTKAILDMRLKVAVAQDVLLIAKTALCVISAVMIRATALCFALSKNLKI